MKKRVVIACISSCLLSGYAVATPSGSGAVVLGVKPMLSNATTPANTSASGNVAEVAATIMETSKHDPTKDTALFKAPDALVAPSGEIKTVDDLAAVMQAFKKEKIAEIQRNLVALEKKLEEAEQVLSAMKNGDADALKKLAYWARVRAALDGERQVLLAIRTMPERMRSPVEVLQYGYDEAKNTITILQAMEPDANGEGSKSKDNVKISLDKFVKNRAKAPAADNEKNLREARDNLANYYDLVMDLYKDFGRMLDGLWLISANDFKKQKEEEINILQERITADQGTAAGEKTIVLEGDNSSGSLSGSAILDKRIAEMVQRKDDAVIQALDHVDRHKRRIEKCHRQMKSIWKEDGKVVDKTELIAQRKIDWQEALGDESEARKVKGNINDLIAAYVAVTNQRHESYSRDQGRTDLEYSLNEARESLGEVVARLRAIDEKDLAASATRVGINALLRESTMLRTQEYMQGSSIFGSVAVGLSKHLSRIKEITPLRAKLEMRLRAVSRIFPGIAATLPIVRVLVNKYAPGMIESWA